MDGESRQSRFAKIPDNQFVSIRAIQASNIEPLLKMYQQTSKSSLYARYLRHHMPEYDELNEFASTKCLVAVLKASPRTIVGVAHYVIQEEQSEVAEPAILIEDGKQLRGLGTQLFLALSQLALSDGIDHFEAVVSANNRAIIGMLKKTELPFTTKYAYGAFDVTIML